MRCSLYCAIRRTRLLDSRALFVIFFFPLFFCTRKENERLVRQSGSIDVKISARKRKDLRIPRGFFGDSRQVYRIVRRRYRTERRSRDVSLTTSRRSSRNVRRGEKERKLWMISKLDAHGTDAKDDSSRRVASSSIEK